MTPEILSIQRGKGVDRITYRYVDGDLVQGPYVQDRPPATDEDHFQFVSAPSRIPTEPEPEKAQSEHACDEIKSVIEKYGQKTFDAAIEQVKSEGK